MAIKKKPYLQAFIFGIISIGMYSLIYFKEADINSTFGKGGVYAFLPILTAFAFSYFHGSFTGHFWSVLGVEAAKKIKEVK